MVRASRRVRSKLDGVSLEAYDNNWELQWIVERGVAIISEASRHLPDELKVRYPEIPWKLIAGIGNIIRHDYGDVSGPIIWKVVTADLPTLKAVCHLELVSAMRAEGFNDDGLSDP